MPYCLVVGSYDNVPTHENFRILYEEIDYINEGQNGDRFRRDFRNIKWVRVPVCFLITAIHSISLIYFPFMSRTNDDFLDPMFP